MPSFLRSVVILPLLAAVACQSEPVPSDSSQGDSSDQSPGADTCDADYPAVFTQGPGRAKEFATEVAKLQKLAPDTEGDLDPLTGAVSFLSTRIPVSLDGQGPICAQVKRAFESLVADREALFRIDPKGFEQITCTNIGTVQALNLGRKELAGMSVAGASENLSIQVQTQPSPALVGFQGFYLPANATVEAREPCFTKKAAAKLPVDLEIPLQTFLACTPTGSGSYTIKSSDKRTVKTLTAVLQPTPDEVSGLELRVAWVIEVKVAAKNVTDELLASDAACATATGAPAIGWTLTIDAVTGELLSVGHSCIVC